MGPDRRSFWTGKRVLITGHTGFKGAWLTLWLHHLGADVVGFSDRIPTEPSLTEQAAIEDLVRGQRGDVADMTQVREVIAMHRPEVLFHLAAQPIVRASYDDPLGTFRTNILGTAVVLDAVRSVGETRATVVVTSDKCYRNDGDGRRFREEDPLGGSDPYSASKAGAEHVAEAYRSSFGAAMGGIASVRAGNVIGGGDWSSNRILPDAARAVSTGATLVVRNPASTRPWQHVLDCLDAYLLVGQRLWERPDSGRAWNVGPTEAEASVRSVIERATERWDGALTWTALPEAGAPAEATRLQLDASAIRELLGWAPRLDTNVAVDVTVDWYRAVADGADPRRVTLDQIETHCGETT